MAGRSSLRPATGLSAPPPGAEPVDHGRRRWQSVRVPDLRFLDLLAAEDSPRAWEDIPVVVLIGVAAGVAFLWIAIRSMFNRKDR